MARTTDEPGQIKTFSEAVKKDLYTDMDGDGKMDILTVNPVNPTSTLSYLRGTGPTQFAPFVNINTGNITAGIVVTDVNGV